MKILVFAACLLAATVAAGQRTLPCLVNVADAGKPPVWTTPSDVPPFTFKIMAGDSYILPISMPVAGECVGTLESYDDRDELAVAALDAAGNYIAIKPAGDIEMEILTPTQLDLRTARLSYVASYTTHRVTSYAFNARLSAGVYFLVLSNRHSPLARKAVTIQFGKPAAEKRP